MAGWTVAIEVPHVSCPMGTLGLAERLQRPAVPLLALVERRRWFLLVVTVVRRLCRWLFLEKGGLGLQWMEQGRSRVGPFLVSRP